MVRKVELHKNKMFMLISTYHLKNYLLEMLFKLLETSIIPRFFERKRVPLWIRFCKRYISQKKM